MKALTVGELAAPVRNACKKAGFKPTDTAEDAIRGSDLLPESSTEITILAKLAGVPRTTVLTWVIHQRQKAAAIQAERLELLGGPDFFRVQVDASGVVCPLGEVACG
jgi:hypothetical protein